MTTLVLKAIPKLPGKVLGSSPIVVTAAGVNYTASLDLVALKATLDAYYQPAFTLAAGMATWLAAPSSANLAAAVTDETGTGALVFGTSPVLTTPTITTKISPTTNDGAPLGDTTHQFSDLFLAAGGVLNWNNGGITITEASDFLTFAGASAGYYFDNFINPSTNDGASLGTASTSWSDLFLASGGVLNWNNGNVTLTHSSGILSLAGILTSTGSTNILTGTAVPVGGTAGQGFKFSSTANLGVFFGSGAPTLSAAQGSLYVRTDGSSTSTRLYVNTNGTTGWTNVTTAT